MTAMTGNKVKEMIGDGRGERYKDGGAGLGGMVKGVGAGLGGMVNGVGAGRQEQGPGSEDINTGNSYLLADPRLVEAHDFGTVVPSTGSARSSSQTLAADNPPYSQHLRGDTDEGEGAELHQRKKGQGRVSGQGQERWPMQGTSGTSIRRVMSTRIKERGWTSCFRLGERGWTLCSRAGAWGVHSFLLQDGSDIAVTETCQTYFRVNLSTIFVSF